MKKVIVLALAVTVMLFVKPATSEAHGWYFIPMVMHHVKTVGVYSATRPAFGMTSILAIEFGPVIAAAEWHVPAWTKAKQADEANNLGFGAGGPAEKTYQDQKMWPQVQIANFSNSLSNHLAYFEK